MTSRSGEPGPAGALSTWQQVGSLSLDEEARTAWAAIPIESSRRFTAIALFPEPAVGSAPICVQLAAAELVGFGSLVTDRADPVARSVCSECTQLVTWSQGHGLFSLPSDGQGPLASPSSLRFRAELRHCAYGIRFVEGLGHAVPEVLRVFTRSEPTVSAAARGSVPIRVAILDEAVSPAQQLSLESSLLKALEHASLVYAPANLQLQVEQVVHVSGAAELVIDPARPTAERELRQTVLSALLSQEEEPRFIPVVFVPCLRVHDARTSTTVRALGQTTSGPGHVFGVEFSSVSYVAWGDCRDAGAALAATSGDVRRLGNVIAHEVGHYLGLHHTDGAAARFADASEGTLMLSDVAGLTPEMVAISETQIAIARQHLDIRFEDN